MTDATQALRLRPLADSSPRAVVAGFHRDDDRLHQLAGADVSGGSGGRPDQRANFLMDLGAVDRHGDLQHRLVAALPHSDHHCLVYPRRCLLITSLGGVSYPEAIGGYITCAVLVIMCGVTGSFERLVKRIPGLTGRRPAGRDSVQDLQ
jgi:benzoate membrane transport protein